MHRIDRFAVRHIFCSQSNVSHGFEAGFGAVLQQHQSGFQQDPEDQMLILERQIRDLCIAFFPKRFQHPSMPTQIPSLSSRMWHARREALRVRGHSGLCLAARNISLNITSVPS